MGGRGGKILWCMGHDIALQKQPPEREFSRCHTGMKTVAGVIVAKGALHHRLKLGVRGITKLGRARDQRIPPCLKLGRYINCGLIGRQIRF